MLPWGSMPDGQKAEQIREIHPGFCPAVHGGLSGSTHTRPVGDGLLGIQLLGANRGTRLEFGLGELGQVGHDGMLVHIGVHNLFRSNHLPQGGTRLRSVLFTWQNLVLTHILTRHP